MAVNTHQLPDFSSPEFQTLCKRWNVVRMEVFGSRLRRDARPDSDVDLMVTFEEGAPIGLFEHVEMMDELCDLFGMPVDLTTRRSVEQARNWIRRESILSSAKIVYEG